MQFKYNTKYPAVEDLRSKAKKNIPRFVFEYLEGGCNEEVNVFKNTSEIRQVEMVPHYLKEYSSPEMKTDLFGHIYDAPFGIAPMGLQGLIWPGAPEILAKAACMHNIPFILSTVSTSSIETISEITEGRAWFQLYHPAEDTLRDDLIKRAESAQCPVLVILSDVPSFGYRPKEIKNGLSIPPRISFSSIMQILGKPNWAIQTLMRGKPGFPTLKPYIPNGMNMRHLGLFMNKTFHGRLNEEKIARIREKWKGKLVVKGIVSEQDAEIAIKLGIDGLIVSNHGGRQLDAGQSSIHSLKAIVQCHRDKIKIMLDSGIRSGPDIARTLASGAQFVFLGRTFMYGVAAMGTAGADHTIAILKNQLHQVMEQISCGKVEDFPNYLISDTQ